MNRDEIIRHNASLRVRGKLSELVPVPPKPEPIYGWELSQRGTYMGFTMDEAEVAEYLENHPLGKAKKVIKR